MKNIAVITLVLFTLVVAKSHAYSLLDLKSKAVEVGISMQQYDIMMEKFEKYEELKKIANSNANLRIPGSSVVGNKKYVMFLDFSISSAEERLYVVDLVSGDISKFLVSHGMGSDINHNGYAESFSNQNSSNKSSLGLYMTAGTYIGKHGESVRLHGLSSSNSNALQRAIVMHSANYVSKNIAQIQGHVGRSHGCPAMNIKDWMLVKSNIKGGVLLLAYNEKLEKKN